MSRRCACCLAWRGDRDCEGVSSLYSPDREFVICEPCFEDEERLIDITGTNEHPAIVRLYRDRTGALDALRAAIAEAQP